MTKPHFHHHGLKTDQQPCKTAEVLDRFGVAYEKKVISAHRTPDLRSNMPKKPVDVVSKSLLQVRAHLPGMVAAKQLFLLLVYLSNRALF